jgi:hypothetical protein
VTRASATLVGPVLIASALGRAVKDAILAANAGAVVLERGGYYRVRALGVCRLERRALEAATGAAFAWPSDLESVMPAFAGRLALDAERAVWSFERP